VGGDPALGLRPDRLSLGLSREREALADRRPPDPARRAAALARQLLRESGGLSRPYRPRLWPPGAGAAPGAQRPRPAREQPHGGDLPARNARVHRRIYRQQQPARCRDNRAVSDVKPTTGRRRADKRLDFIFCALFSVIAACRRPSLMRIRISHLTSYRYATRVTSVIQRLRLPPRNHDGQYVARWRIDVSADCRLDQHEDAFGNITHAFTAEGPFSELTVTAEGEVETRDTQGVVRGAVERFPPSLYL